MRYRDPMQIDVSDFPEDDWSGITPDFGDTDRLCIEGMLCLWLLQEELDDLAGERIERLTTKIHNYMMAMVAADRHRAIEPSMN